MGEGRKVLENSGKIWKIPEKNSMGLKMEMGEGLGGGVTFGGRGLKEAGSP